MVSASPHLSPLRPHTQNRACGVGLALFILLYFAATVLFIIFA